MNSLKKYISGWGLYPRVEASVYRPEKNQDLQEVFLPGIARGCGRSYGDAAQLLDGNVILTERLNRLLAFDAERGIVRAEAGVTISDLLHVFVPKGWFPPVTPGTKWVTLGGCVAADVHGKNHHVDGSFGRHVLGLELVLADGSRVRCSPRQEAQLFWATVGGMGLTGIISEITLQLKRISTAYIAVQNTPVANLEALFSYLSDYSQDDQYSVAWVDCMATDEHFGRGIVVNGHHASVAELTDKEKHPFRIKKSVARSLPLKLLSTVFFPKAIQKFNQFYYSYFAQIRGTQIVDYDRFFYPLDCVKDWNLLYGKKGFIQYQFVTPLDCSLTVCRQVLEILAHHRLSPYLAVLKRFGPENEGFLSFPKEGYTLAIDIPIRNEHLFTVLDQLDQLILQNNGRLYLAKDARLSATYLRAMYPRLEEWKKVKKDVDDQGNMMSDLAKRLRL